MLVNLLFNFNSRNSYLNVKITLHSLSTKGLSIVTYLYSTCLLLSKLSKFVYNLSFCDIVINFDVTTLPCDAVFCMLRNYSENAGKYIFVMPRVFFRKVEFVACSGIHMGPTTRPLDFVKYIDIRVRLTRPTHSKSDDI